MDQVRNNWFKRMVKQFKRVLLHIRRLCSKIQLWFQDRSRRCFTTISQWFIENWRWRTDWMLPVAVVFLGLGFLLGFTYRWSDPAPDNARYLLSAMAQVIGAVFVLTVAFIQVIGRKKDINLEGLLSRWYFIVTLIVSLLGIVVPLVVLYFNWLCRGTVISLGLGIASIITIWWFIMHLIRDKGLEIKARIFEELKAEYRRKSLIELERTAMDNLSADIRSIPKEIIEELRDRAMEELNDATPDTTILKDICGKIQSITKEKTYKSPEVMRAGINALIELNETAYNMELTDLNFEITSLIVSLPVRYAVTKDAEWSLIRNHISEYFGKALHEGRIELERASSHTEIDYLSAMSSLLLAAAQVKNDSKWNEVSEKIISEFEGAMKKPQLRERYKPQAVFALIYHVLTDRCITFHEWQETGKAEVVSRLITLAKVIYGITDEVEAKKRACDLLKESRIDIFGLKYSLKISHDRYPNWPREAYPEIEARLCGET